MSKKPIFGGWAIEKAVYDKIVEMLPAGSTILELGSGTGTMALARHYRMFSVEHNIKWMDRFETVYIHAPLMDYGDLRWYDVEILKMGLPDKYDMVIVDGPPSRICAGDRGRFGFLENLELFNLNGIPIVFDDTHREQEKELMVSTAARLNRPWEVFQGEKKQFGIVN